MEGKENYKNRVEAILFTTGRFMDVNEISKLCGIGSVGIIREIIEEIKNDYVARSSSLAVYEEDNKWKLGIRREFNYLTTQLLTESELNNSTIKTLALVAYKQPILQSDIIKMRGNGAYDHIRVLKEMGLLISEKKGRTRALKLASKFFDYFDIADSELRVKMQEIKIPETLLQQDISKPLEEEKAGEDAKQE